MNREERVWRYHTSTNSNWWAVQPVSPEGWLPPTDSPPHPCCSQIVNSWWPVTSPWRDSASRAPTNERLHSDRGQHRRLRGTTSLQLATRRHRARFHQRVISCSDAISLSPVSVFIHRHFPDDDDAVSTMNWHPAPSLPPSLSHIRWTPAEQQQQTSTVDVNGRRIHYSILFPLRGLCQPGRTETESSLISLFSLQLLAVPYDPDSITSWPLISVHCEIT